MDHHGRPCGSSAATATGKDISVDVFGFDSQPTVCDADSGSLVAFAGVRTLVPFQKVILFFLVFLIFMFGR